MSIRPDERLIHAEALERLRELLRDESRRRCAWQAWALVLEQQMRREGWTQADLDELPTVRPE